MKLTKQDKRDIDKTIDILESVKDSIEGLTHQHTMYDAISVAVLWLERIIRENENDNV